MSKERDPIEVAWPRTTRPAALAMLCLGLAAGSLHAASASPDFTGLAGAPSVDPVERSAPAAPPPGEEIPDLDGSLGETTSPCGPDAVVEARLLEGEDIDALLDGALLAPGEASPESCDEGPAAFEAEVESGLLPEWLRLDPESPESESP